MSQSDSITLPEFWVWKLSESGPAEIARKVGNLPEFWVWKLPEIKASFFAAALKKQGIFSCYCKALSPICCSYKCCSTCYIFFFSTPLQSWGQARLYFTFGKTEWYFRKVARIMITKSAIFNKAYNWSRQQYCDL